MCAALGRSRTRLGGRPASSQQAVARETPCSRPPQSTLQKRIRRPPLKKGQVECQRPTGQQEPEADALLDTSLSLANAWSAWGAHTKEATKHLLHVQTDNDFSTHLDHERTLIEAAGTTPAFKEGVRAFLEKRPPKFD